MVFAFQHISEVTAFDLWPLDLVKSNIPASVLKDGRILLEILTFKSKMFFFKTKKGWLWPLAYWFQGPKLFWKSQFFNDLNSLLGLKKNCMHFTFWVLSLVSRTSAASTTLTASTTSVASMIVTASFHHFFFLLNLEFPPTLAPKWPILVSKCGMNHQKSNILLILGTLSNGRCGGMDVTFH